MDRSRSLLMTPFPGIRIMLALVLAGLAATDVAAQTRVVEGTRYSDQIDESGSDVPVEVYGLGGRDTITGSRFGDTLDGGSGNDNIRGGGGDDAIVVSGTAAGLDVVSGEQGYDRIVGSPGDDNIAFNRIYGGSQSVEEIDGGGGFNQILGTRYADVLDFSTTLLTAIATISAKKGDDDVFGSTGNDVIEGGEGNDDLFGNAGDDVFLVSGTGKRPRRRSGRRRLRFDTRIRGRRCDRVARIRGRQLGRIDRRQRRIRYGIRWKLCRSARLQRNDDAGYRADRRGGRQ